MEDKKDSNKARGGRLARRAKSFKEDFLGKLNQIRSPSGTRAGSPGKGSKSKMKLTESDLFEEKVTSNSSVKDVDSILHSARLLTSALRYFQDVVQKKKLEMLPGSATVVLETVVMIHASLRKALVDEQSSLVLSATNQVYQSLANLIRWSDMILLHGDKALEKDVFNVIQPVQDAIKTLIQLSIDKLQNKESKACNSSNQNGVYSPNKPESPHRNSLPDIPLTPREREILEQTQFPDFQASQSVIHHSASSDSILGGGTHAIMESKLPPPKPPLPEFRNMNIRHSSVESPLCSKEFLLDCAPPLPPKKKPAVIGQQLADQGFFASSDTILFNQSCRTSSSGIVCSHSLERTSPFSQSPENLTPLSKSSASSLDSILNYSTDDLSLGQQKHLYLSHTCFDTSFKHNVFSNSSQTFSCELITCTSKSESKTSSIVEGINDSTDNVNNFLKKVISNETLMMKTDSDGVCLPPALPLKLRSTKVRALSQYDNVPQLLVSNSDDQLQGNEGDLDIISQPGLHDHQHWLTSDHAPSCPQHKILNRNEVGKPPPLPPKKKTIMAYMEMFGSYSQPSEAEFLRHSLHTYNIIQANWQQMELSFFQQHSFSSGFVSGSEDSISFDVSSRHNDVEKTTGDKITTVTTPPALPPKKSRVNSLNMNQFQPSISPPSLALPAQLHSPVSPESEIRNLSTSDNDNNLCLDVDDLGALEELDATHYIICKKVGEEGPDIRGGTVDSLIVQATKASKNDFLYQEAFLTTYRTFITPSDLLKKLLYRYSKFIHLSDMRQRAARNAFALLVRVVDDMCIADIQEDILKVLMDFIFQLVSRGELMLARALRKKVVEKCEARQKSLTSTPVLLPSMAITTHQASLLDFKSESLAEQMTLLDADLFQMIEIPEVLLWAKEQKEELSPNLTKFTEHFNKMSFWARSRILDQEEAKDRERYVVKFIKIMKYLRKLNNFNSYLAILSALDSAPIRRLEWQRNITEGLKEYCALIDSSSSFRAYRQALAETCPPCIPYIGLILQDLTFVHIGNSDWVSEGNVNFSKRWQQFNILDNMRRFKNCQYPFRRNDQIIAFFNNFDNYLCEEAMWQISETIKPRGGKKKNCDQL